MVAVASKCVRVTAAAMSNAPEAKPKRAPAKLPSSRFGAVELFSPVPIIAMP
jgi:hypothetical protein